MNHKSIIPQVLVTEASKSLSAAAAAMPMALINKARDIAHRARAEGHGSRDAKSDRPRKVNACRAPDDGPPTRSADIAQQALAEPADDRLEPTLVDRTKSESDFLGTAGLAAPTSELRVPVSSHAKPPPHQGARIIRRPVSTSCWTPGSHPAYVDGAVASELPNTYWASKLRPERLSGL